MISRFIRLMTIALPAIGLISCTVNKQPDTWQRKVHAEWVEDRKVHTETLTALNAPTVPADAKLIFDNTDIKQGHFKSSCSSTSPLINRAKREGKFSASDVTIADLLPKEFWLHVGWTSEATINCAIEFEVTNENNSTWSFKVSQMTVKRLDQLVNMKAVLPEGTWALMDQPMIFEGIDFTPNGESTVELVCQKFRNSRTVTGPTQIPTITRELRYGDVSQELIEFDYRDVYQNQQCQFLMTAKGTDGVVWHRLSQTFDLKFADPLIKYSVSQLSLPFGEGAAEVTHAHVLEITIVNKSRHPQQFQLTQAQGNNIGLHGIMSNPYKESYFGGDERLAHLDFKASSGKLINNDPMHPVYEVDGGTTLKIYAEIQISYHCSIATDLPMPDVERYRTVRGLLVGFTYRFTAGGLVNLVKHQTDKSEQYELLDDPTTIGFSDSKPGWTPIENWKVEHGDERVSPITFETGDICTPKGQEFQTHVF